VLTPDATGRDLTAPLAAFAQNGFARLGRVLSDDGARRLRSRADALMQVQHPGLFYQHDSETGRYEDLVFNEGWVGPSVRYRKIERLELDPLFLSFVENPFFRRLTRLAIGDAVALYRVVLWNKAPGAGMPVPWHQDDGRFWGLDRAPFLQVWTALDDAPVESGCLEVLPGSHRGGLSTPEGGTVPQHRLDGADAEANALALPARSGEAILVHNHTWHRTARNQTPRPRRAVSISFLGVDVRCTRRQRAPRRFRELFVSSEGASGAG
jgi:hypothetical protein